ncbi:unnamed protein product, partial [marine sediment metagenome]
GTNDFTYYPERLAAIRKLAPDPGAMAPFLDLKASGYYTHKPDTKFSDEEIEYMLRNKMPVFMKLHGVRCINWKVSSPNPSYPIDGHPYMIGNKHMQGDGMYIDNTLPCAMRGCGQPASAHTCDKVLVLELTENCTSSAAGAALKPLLESVEEHGIDGAVFMETDPQYKVIEDDAEQGVSL